MHKSNLHLISAKNLFLTFFFRRLLKIEEVQNRRMEKNNSQLKNRSTESCSTKQNRVGTYLFLTSQK